MTFYDFFKTRPQNLSKPPQNLSKTPQKPLKRVLKLKTPQNLSKSPQNLSKTSQNLSKPDLAGEREGGKGAGRARKDEREEASENCKIKVQDSCPVSSKTAKQEVQDTGSSTDQ